MSPTWEHDPVDRITAGAVGEPGSRTFFLQARRGPQLVSLLCEKQQVVLLAELIGQLLERIEDPEVASAAVNPALELEEPIDPAFRVGQVAIGYDPERDLVMIQCDEFVDVDEDDDEDEDSDALSSDEPLGDRWRFWATRNQVRDFASHAVAVAQAGRPVCRMCGGPIDPEGHFCPPSNGHREVSDLPGT